MRCGNRRKFGADRSKTNLSKNRQSMTSVYWRVGLKGLRQNLIEGKNNHQPKHKYLLHRAVNVARHKHKVLHYLHLAIYVQYWHKMNTNSLTSINPYDLVIIAFEVWTLGKTHTQLAGQIFVMKYLNIQQPFKGTVSWDIAFHFKVYKLNQYFP